MLRDHNTHDAIGPRLVVYAANLEMYRLDIDDRIPDMKDEHGIGYCNITPRSHGCCGC